MSNITGGNFAPQDVVVYYQSGSVCAVILPWKIAQVLRARLPANKRRATSMVVGDKMQANKKREGR